MLRLCLVLLRFVESEMVWSASLIGEIELKRHQSSFEPKLRYAAGSNDVGPLAGIVHQLYVGE